MKHRIEAWIDDIRFAARGLWRTKGFTTVAVVCLALGIGGTVAIFSVVETILWKPLPYPASEDLVEVSVNDGGTWSLPLADFYLEQQDVFESAGGIRPMRYNATLGDQTVEIPGAQVTPGLLVALGLQPTDGRMFEPDDDRVDARPVALVSTGLSDRLYHGRALGESLWLDGSAFEVVGVLPSEFDGVLGDYDVFVTPGQLRDEFPLNHVGASRFQLVGRLAKTMSIVSVETSVKLLPERMQERWPILGTISIAYTARPLADAILDDSSSTIWLLMGAVVSVLLIACANVANLLLTRGAGRAREIAVRQAIGASRATLLRQYFAEGLLLVTIGACGGLLVAAWGVYFLANEATDLIPMVTRVQLDFGVLAFTVTISIVSALMFSVFPALFAPHEELTRHLQSGGAGSSTRGNRATQKWIVALEVGLALVLMVGAGLSLRSVQHLRAVDLGFEPSNAIVAAFELPAERYPDGERRAAFSEELLAAVRTQPGVSSACALDMVPLMPNSGLNTNVVTLDMGTTPLVDLPRSQAVTTATFAVGPGCAEALGLRLVRGRLFNADDYADGGSVVVLDETIARALYGDADPVGRDLRTWRSTVTVIGVVAPVRSRDLTSAPETGASFYPDATPWNQSGAGLVARTRGNETDLVQAMRGQALAIDSQLPAFTVESYDASIATQIAEHELLLQLLGLFAVIAVTMAGVGIFGVTNYAVAQRTSEIGIRMALGAPPSLVVALVARDALSPVAVGMLGGTAVAMMATQVLESLIYGVDRIDAPSYAAALIGTALIAAIASYLPVRRAVRIPPMSALRQD